MINKISKIPIRVFFYYFLQLHVYRLIIIPELQI